ncbi:unnamed protein product [Dovyalis caffra]|uniref:Uncharacterized protein n=1 Tax=Dovyalis caffra TaxID=77055 RepID=A0AAV1RSC7_9ROSI|nr:unnamed protein product [Dovyalis caffra]
MMMVDKDPKKKLRVLDGRKSTERNSSKPRELKIREVPRMSRMFVRVFHTLKTLCLPRVVYIDGSSMYKLFSSRPVLENMSIRREGWDGYDPMCRPTTCVKVIVL